MNKICFILFLSFVFSSCGEGEIWTPWVSRDLPHGVGDFESIDKLIDEGLLSASCAQPLKIECRTIEDQIDWRETGEAVECNTEIGGQCTNSIVIGTLPCSDYEVRFVCP